MDWKKSFGCEIDFKLKGGDKINIFTTRPDTIFGASFLALSVDHPISKKFLRKTRTSLRLKKSVIKLEPLKRPWLVQRNLDLILTYS